MITIDKQIKHLKKYKGSAGYAYFMAQNDAILASLERLKRIDSAKVPEHLNIFFEHDGIEKLVIENAVNIGGIKERYVSKHDYDTLRDLLKRDSADRAHYQQKSDMLSEAAFASEERAETLQRQLDELKSASQPDYEAIAWAIKKLSAFGVHQSTMDNAMMVDRLELMLRAAGGK